MAMTTVELTEKVNILVNKALNSNIVYTAIATVLTTQAAAVTALGATFTHGRTIQDPGPTLNPSLPQPP